LLHVLDVSSERAPERASIVQQVLTELGVSEQPLLMVVNKADLLASSAEELERTLPEARVSNSVVVSAELGWNIPELLDRIEAMLKRRYERVRGRHTYHPQARATH